LVTGPVPLFALLALVVEATAPVVPVRLEVQGAGTLPFSLALLEAAVEARQPVARGDQAAAAAAVIVRSLGGGWVVIESQSRRQQLAVHGRPAPEAARLVALAVLDVLRPELSLSPEPAPAAPAVATRTAPPPPASSADRRRGVDLSLLPGASFGFGSGAASFEPTAALTWWTGRPLAGGVPGLTAEMAFNRATASLNQRPFVLDTLPVRLGARWGWRWLDAGGGMALRAYRTSGLDGGSGALAGGFLSVRAGLPLGWGLRGLAAASCDLVTQRLDFRAGGLTVMSTRHAIPWLGVGLAWEGSR
jgi:hypothetical protein